MKIIYEDSARFFGDKTFENSISRSERDNSYQFNDVSRACNVKLSLRYRIFTNAIVNTNF